MDSESSTVLVFLAWSIAAILLSWIIWRQIRIATSQPLKPAAPPALEVPVRVIKRKSGLNSDILREGDGPAAKNLDLLTVHYDAFLKSGEKIDSSYDRGRTLTFKLGKGAVIIGWDTALVGMREGEKRRVTVPADQAYGSKGQNKVPPNADVIFVIECLKIE